MRRACFKCSQTLLARSSGSCWELAFVTTPVWGKPSKVFRLPAGPLTFRAAGELSAKLPVAA